jgi:hypothetical protein
MRRRAFLLALLVGGLAAVGAVGLSGSGTPWHDPASTRSALARAELADVPAPTALTRTRDVLGRDADARYGIPAALAVALAITRAGGWWLARERAARVRPLVLVALRRTRAPPRLPSIVHC